jgi:hypothetical protein
VLGRPEYESVPPQIRDDPPRFGFKLDTVSSDDVCRAQRVRRCAPPQPRRGCYENICSPDRLHEAWSSPSPHPVERNRRHQPVTRQVMGMYHARSQSSNDLMESWNGQKVSPIRSRRKIAQTHLRHGQFAVLKGCECYANIGVRE